MRVSINKKYNTKAYDKLEAFCDDLQGGDSCFTMADKFDRQQVVNLIYEIIQKEIKAKADNKDLTQSKPKKRKT